MNLYLTCIYNLEKFIFPFVIQEILNGCSFPLWGLYQSFVYNFFVSYIQFSVGILKFQCVCVCVCIGQSWLLSVFFMPQGFYLYIYLFVCLFSPPPFFFTISKALIIWIVPMSTLHILAGHYSAFGLPFSLQNYFIIFWNSYVNLFLPICFDNNT